MDRGHHLLTFVESLVFYKSFKLNDTATQNISMNKIQLYIIDKKPLFIIPKMLSNEECKELIEHMESIQQEDISHTQVILDSQDWADNLYERINELIRTDIME